MNRRLIYIVLAALFALPSAAETPSRLEGIGVTTREVTSAETPSRTEWTGRTAQTGRSHGPTGLEVAAAGTEAPTGTVAVTGQRETGTAREVTAAGPVETEPTREMAVAKLEETPAGTGLKVAAAGSVEGKTTREVEITPTGQEVTGAGPAVAAEESGIQQRIEAMAADQAFGQAVVGICARKADGKTLVDINSKTMMLPASNMKLITTGAALHALGTDMQFETSIGYDGTVEDGTLYGDLYIIGGGDPTLGSKDSIAVDIDHTFAQWEAIIRANGISRIEGRIIGDGRWFEGMAEEPTWLLEDAGTYYGTGTTGLMFYENMQSFAVSAGAQVGDPVNISPSYPDAPWMEFRYNCSTGEKGTGDMLYMYASDLTPIAEIRGTFGVDRAAKRLDCANKFPEHTCASYFHDFLKKRGLECSGGVADLNIRESELEDIDSLTVIGSTFSPTLDRIVFETNHASNNLYAETLMRTLGKELRGNACYDSSYVALNDVLKILKVDFSKGAQIQDGSGLSRQNYISADFICRFLAAMTESPSYGTFLASLPSPGGNGTLQYNMSGKPASLRNRIKVKSGSMNGVRCYSGYILPSENSGGQADGLPADTIVFSILTNNCTSPTWQVRPLLDSMMAALAECN
ncbi:MAG: D-alanyl-D-alanine carboxypeptidase/D-alanyl-D-alanine-endopeptidase [Bacteroidales bacterium]|nr:D-alanyl-D-alanine carboxypeptidase/D-alanyl-D-alanine-endopeptidase [Bacteroidales bacterium]